MNQIINLSNLIYRKSAAKKQLFPIWADIEVTHKCNLKCKHCYLPEKINTEKEISFTDICNILNQLAEMGVFYLKITGGEPFLRKDIINIIKYAKKKQFLVSVYTNAILISEEFQNILSDLYIKVETTILGTEKIHDEITQKKGSFDRTFKNIIDMKHKGIDVTAKYLIFKDNFNCFDSVTKMLKKHGIKYETDKILLSPRIDGTTDFKNLKLSKKQIADLLPKINFEKEKNIVMEPYICGAAKTMIAISAYGEVMPCNMLRTEISFRDLHISDIFYNHEFFEKIRAVKASDFKSCKNCSGLKFCRMCLANNYLSSGNIFKPYEDACKLNKQMVKVYNE